jgi:transcriptional regulator with XRE-family HTH domain
MRELIAVEDVMASLPKARRRAIEARGAELLAKIERRMTLGELRKRRKFSQTEMADVLGIGQMQISRLENRKDPRLSTLRKTVAAMGGSLTMIAMFPDQEPVILIPSHETKENATGGEAQGAKRQPAPRPTPERV